MENNEMLCILGVNNVAFSDDKIPAEQVWIGHMVDKNLMDENMASLKVPPISSSYLNGKLNEQSNQTFKEEKFYGNTTGKPNSSQNVLLANSKPSTSTDKTSKASHHTRNRIWKFNEAPEVRARRLAKLRIREANRRARETSEERASRLEKKRKIERWRRACETPEARAYRLEKNRKDAQFRRANETPEQRAQRLLKKRRIEKVRRATETQDERSYRLERKRMDSQKRRAYKKMTL